LKDPIEWASFLKDPIEWALFLQKTLDNQALKKTWDCQALLFLI
jgi:hypothetical protein